MKNKDRRLELSSKFMEMGQALINEGNESKDYTVLQMGTFMILMSTTVFSDEDTYMFGELCSMFSAKKMLDEMTQTDNPISEYIKSKSTSTSYDDFIKKINDMRKGD